MVARELIWSMRENPVGNYQEIYAFIIVYYIQCLLHTTKNNNKSSDTCMIVKIITQDEV